MLVILSLTRLNPAVVILHPTSLCRPPLDPMRRHGFRTRGHVGMAGENSRPACLPMMVVYLGLGLRSCHT